jgi:hypothetical protein
MREVGYKRISNPVDIYWGPYKAGQRTLYVYARSSGSSGPYFVKLDGKYREVRRVKDNRWGWRWLIVGSNAEYTRYLNQPKMYSKPKYVK